MSFLARNVWRNKRTFAGIFKRFEHDGKVVIQHRVSPMEKKFLVWTGKYKKVEDVPAEVGLSVMDQTRNKMRIKIANYMMAATAVGCVLMVYLGKQAASRGETLSEKSTLWHKALKEEADAEKAKLK